MRLFTLLPGGAKAGLGLFVEGYALHASLGAGLGLFVEGYALHASPGAGLGLFVEGYALHASPGAGLGLFVEGYALPRRLITLIWDPRAPARCLWETVSPYALLDNCLSCCAICSFSCAI